MNNTALRHKRRADKLTAILKAAPDPTDHGAVRDYLVVAAEAGLAILPVIRGSKAPFDGRSNQQRQSDNETFRRLALAAGRTVRHGAKSPAGVHLASTDPQVLSGYLDHYQRRYGSDCAVNLAVAVGPSRLVIVDCDTREQMRAFLSAGRIDPDAVATVSTPGAMNAEGWMVHSDGGHFWFTVPDGVELPDGPGYLTVGSERWAVMWNGRYALMPPSVRPEGAYEVVGEVAPAPDWLIALITERAHLEKPVADRTRVSSCSTPIGEWSRSVDWGEILDPRGWTPTTTLDSCGCPIWTAPGFHASVKSATAHDPGCGAPHYDSDNPPLHIWTDNPGEPFAGYIARTGHSTLSKLQAVALVDFAGNVGDAMEAFGLIPDPVTLGKATGANPDARSRGHDSTGADRQLRITWADTIEPEPVEWLWVDITEANNPSDPFAVAGHDVACVGPDNSWVSPEVETDGRLACGMVSIAAGREGTGKSSFGIWLAAKITRGILPGAHYGTPKRVFYLASEDSWQHTLVPRMMAAGADLEKVARIEVVVQERNEVMISLPGDVDLLTAAIVENDVAMVVIDPLMSTLGAGLDANASRDVRTALEPLKAMAEKTRAAVIAIAHFNKATGLDALSRITGSGAFKDVARAVMVFAQGNGEGVFTQPKNSVGRSNLPSLSYEIQPAVVETPTGMASTGVFRFTAIADRSVDELLSDERNRGKNRSPVTEFVIRHIRENADPATGEIDAAKVIEAGLAQGFSEKQITDARSRVRWPTVSTRREGFAKDGRSIWKIDG